MECDEVRDLIEPLAAGDIAGDPTAAAHVAVCRDCAAALALARMVDRSLAARPIPAAPAQFVGVVLDRVSRDRWRAERSIDLWFNLFLALGGLAIVGGFVTLMNLSGLGAVAGDLAGLLGAGLVLVAGRVGAALPVYAAAIALLVIAFGFWWWTERRPV